MWAILSVCVCACMCACMCACVYSFTVTMFNELSLGYYVLTKLLLFLDR